MFKPRAIAAAATTLSLTAAGAFAGMVHPGETVVINEDGLTMPEGAVLAQSVLPFSIAYEADAGSFLDFDGNATGVLTNTVLRDEQTGTLVFVYDVDLAGEGDTDASEASILTATGFAGFSTDVTGTLDFETVVLGSRTDDGADVKLSSDDPGLGGAPRLVVRTDATAFDDTGSAKFFAGDELAVRTPDGVSIEFAAGSAVLFGTFEPAADEAPPTAIPLPPAVWSGLAGLGAMGAARGFTRFRRRRIKRAAVTCEM